MASNPLSRRRSLERWASGMRWIHFLWGRGSLRRGSFWSLWASLLILANRWEYGTPEDSLYEINGRRVSDGVEVASRKHQTGYCDLGLTGAWESLYVRGSRVYSSWDGYP